MKISPSAAKVSLPFQKFFDPLPLQETVVRFRTWCRRERKNGTMGQERIRRSVTKLIQI